MNMQAIMAQARKLQGELEKTTKEIDNTIFNYENDNILVECNGKNEIKKITIKNEDVLEDREMLEDIVLVAVNNVLEKVKTEKDKKLGKYTNGLGGLF
ncbi:MAG: YbaB/EbfC family nucleoid-associated protein [Bacilli bacterium]|nr:YbaB/EbfC family nucleoid-associated protein [Bacilli bacterium]